MKNIQLFNCFDCANGFYLIEAVINDKSGKIDFSRFSPNRRKGDENAECADSKLYAIQFLDPTGCERICELFNKPMNMRPCRVAFFVADNYGEIMNTPYGQFELRNPEPLPDRLINCVEFIGMADRDKYDYYNDEALD